MRWAWAGNAPFQWGKQVASHFGGTRNPMVVSWPARIKDKGGLRSQFSHVIDVAPTILEVAGVTPPERVDGIPQLPIHGTSFAYTFDDAAAKERHTQQYFEILGNRAMYKDGWIACARLDRVPWRFDPATLGGSRPAAAGTLTRIVGSFTISRRISPSRKNLAAQHPEKLRELKELFWSEAEKYHLTPLLGGMAPFFGLGPAGEARAGSRTTRAPGTLAQGMIPPVYNRSFTIIADLDVPPGGPRV